MPNETVKPGSPLPSQGNQTANARRKYLHVLEGGTLKPHDLSLIVADMEALDARVAELEGEDAALLAMIRQTVKDYPYDPQHPLPLREAVWAVTEGYKGVSLACDDLQKRIAALEAENAKLREELAEARKVIHLVYDLLAEAGTPTQQYDFTTRRNSGIESARAFLTRKETQ